MVKRIWLMFIFSYLNCPKELEENLEWYIEQAYIMYYNLIFFKRIFLRQNLAINPRLALNFWYLCHPLKCWDYHQGYFIFGWFFRVSLKSVTYKVDTISVLSISCHSRSYLRSWPYCRVKCDKEHKIDAPEICCLFVKFETRLSSFAISFLCAVIHALHLLYYLWFLNRLPKTGYLQWYGLS